MPIIYLINHSTCKQFNQVEIAPSRSSSNQVQLTGASIKCRGGYRPRFLPNKITRSVLCKITPQGLIVTAVFEREIHPGTIRCHFAVFHFHVKLCNLRNPQIAKGFAGSFDRIFRSFFPGSIAASHQLNNFVDTLSHFCLLSCAPGTQRNWGSNSNNGRLLILRPLPPSGSD